MSKKFGKTCRFESLENETHLIKSQGNIEIQVMQVLAEPENRLGAVVLIHGAGSPSSAIWDLRFRDYSMMRFLACRGFDAYAVDLRGFGGSTKTPPGDVRAHLAVADVDAAVEMAQRDSAVDRVHVLGWSWGADVAALYASQHPERVDRLVLVAPVYDRKWPNRHAKTATTTTLRPTDFWQHFDANAEESEVFTEFVQRMFAGQAQLVLPTGPYMDIYGPNAPIWQADKIFAKTLVIRGDEDKASLETHALRLFHDLKNAPSRRYVGLGGMNHFPFRHRRYREFQSAIAGFLAE